MCDPTSAYDELYSMQHHVIKIVSDGVKQFINVYQCIQWLTNPPPSENGCPDEHTNRETDILLGIA